MPRLAKADRSSELRAKTLSLDLRLNGPQFNAFHALGPGRTVFLGFGRGVGKSWFLRRLWWLTVAQWEYRVRANCPKKLRGVRIIPIMPTLKQFKDVHGPDIEEELSPGGEFGFLRGKIDRTSWQIRFPGGSWVKPFPASQYSSRTSRGMRGDVLSPDEIDDIDALVYDAVAGPWLSEPWSLRMELCAGTPTRGRHGLWYRLLDAGRKGERLRKGEVIDGLEPAQAEALKSVYAFHATHRDAPETVSALAVAKAKALITPSTFKREWEADPDAGEGNVYPFDENFHVAGAKDCPHAAPPPLRAFREFIVGMDHGWVDAGVLLLIGIIGHGRDAEAWVLDEWYESECPNDTWDDRAKEWQFATIFADPSRRDRIETLKADGLTLGDTDNEIYGGIARVANMLFKRVDEDDEPPWAQLYVAPKCVNTIWEFGNYRRKKRKDGSFDETPEDKNNHAMDALRYALVGRFGLGESVRSVVSGR